MAGVLLKQVREASQSRLSKAVKNPDKASSIEAAFGFANVFSCATTDSTIAVVNTKKPTNQVLLSVHNSAT